MGRMGTFTSYREIIMINASYHSFLSPFSRTFQYYLPPILKLSQWSCWENLSKDILCSSTYTYPPTYVSAHIFCLSSHIKCAPSLFHLYPSSHFLSPTRGHHPANLSVSCTTWFASVFKIIPIHKQHAPNLKTSPRDFTSFYHYGSSSLFSFVTESLKRVTQSCD